MVQDKQPDTNAKEQTAFSAPSISLPKGGGAIQGIGEKFAANPVTGTGSLTVPITTSPGRSGFGPQLALSYDSGSGNGPFGFGWSLSLPTITRKTDKGLPQYHDAEESDVYILSGSEDLVPVLRPDGSRFEEHTITPGFTIHRYRPRIEGLFARIERWTDQATGEIHWRSITRDNVTTLYGQTAESRVADPADPRRVFSWSICQSYDDKGNAIVYEYAAENDENVDHTQANERNRARAANRYLKRVKYGNRVSRLLQPDLAQMEWMFEVLFDYDESHYEVLDPARPEAEQHRFVRASALVAPAHTWAARPDPFSSYRSGFEVRTYRRCHRVLMFHRFAELGVEPTLVRSTEFEYADLDYSQPTTLETELAHQGSTRFSSFIHAVTQAGFVRDDAQAVLERDGISYVTYLKKSLPPLEFEYSKAHIQDDVRELDSGSLENLPVGLDGATYRWVDLNGEGLSGILTEQANAWFYKPNLGEGQFGPLERLVTQASLAALGSGQQQLLDLAGDGQLDLVALSGPTPGFYERSHDEDWEPFRAFVSLPNVPWDDPNLRFVDLNSDGHTDVLVTEEDVFTWYSSLAEEGFGPARQVHQSPDEEQGPRLVFADGTQSIYLADMCGDGLTDLARVRNGEVCYWPNLGYGRFGAKVTMDDAPHFDHPDQFNQQRVRLADIDGSGANDVIYLGHDGVRLYFNQSGNRWTEPYHLHQFPRVDNLSSVMTADLLGNSTACLVWSSPLPTDAQQPLRYVDLMGGQKPHLLIKSTNNLGAETIVQYASSTKFYLADKLAGTPWITKLPFPVHVVERTETHDHVSGNRFVTRYAYHHGYFDGQEREFRGFALVEQWDTEEFAALTGDGTLPDATNVDAASHVPPVLTKTWFHTGLYVGRDHVSDFFAGLLDEHDAGEYFREPGLTDAQARESLLPDTVMPPGLTLEEEREACRALKGAMLRQETYALDGTDRAEIPYTVTEQNMNIRRLQPRDDNRHAVFFTHPREAISYHYERNPADPRISHTLTLEVDEYGNVLKSLAIGYGRRQSPLTEQRDREKQTTTLITYTDNSFTNTIDDNVLYPGHYRAPLPAEVRTYELTSFEPENNAARFSFDEWTRNGFGLLASAVEIPYEQTADGVTGQKRLIEHVRTLYRKDDLSTFSPISEVEPLALPGENYKLALTPGLLSHVFTRDQAGQPTDLLPNPAPLLEGKGGDQGGYVAWDGGWWIPSGRAFFDHGADVADPASTAAQEVTSARQHFYLPRKVADPFDHCTVVDYDGYDLLVARTSDALGNTVTAANDYRVLQPRLVIDPNRNRASAAFDALGMVVATAVMGKAGENLGDLLEGFDADLTLSDLQAFIADPRAYAASLLGKASTRIVYDLERYRRAGQPPFAATLARETHFYDPLPADGLRIQINFAYSDGFGREIQKKIQAEAGDAAQRQADVLLPTGDVHPGDLVRDAQDELVQAHTPRRWVGSGRTVFNNKGKPVRQYEPFFSATHLYEAEREMTDTGVSPVLFYDPVERVVATLHPNQTYEKVVFDPWQQTTYDVNDTVAANGAQTGDPRTDPDVAGYVCEYFATQPAAWQTWYAQRIGNPGGDPDLDAAQKAAAHADTPTVAHLDALGRPFLTIAHNRYEQSGALVEEEHATRVELDVEGNQRAVRDARDHVVMRYAYTIAGPEQDENGQATNTNRLHQASMEAGERWTLNDVSGKPIRAWDSRGHDFCTEYDPLRRPLRSFVTGADPANPNQEILTERSVYGERHPQDELHNLRGQLYLHLDQAGAIVTGAYDFKGNSLRASRYLTSGTQYRHTVDWFSVDANHIALPPDAAARLDPAALQAALAPLLEAAPYTSHTTYDALNRPVTLTTPHTSTMQPSVIRPGYNEANLLERVDANLRGASSGGQPVWTPFVTNIDYDAKGQRQRIDYGNGVSTFYEYDPLTFRLVHLLTQRSAVVFPDDCPQPPPAAWPGCQVQNLHYSYDPAGNITRIRDEAQQTVYFRNRRVEPSAEYVYDAVYRLVKATGREHLGQIGGTPIPHSHDDAPRAGIDWSANDGKAMGAYIERYVYDTVGNLMAMQHRGSDPLHPGWTRTYAYDETSQLEAGEMNNRLSSTTAGSNNPLPERYVYDAHGNMIRMPHLGGAHPDANMHWDHRDQLRQTDLSGGGTAYYVYDAAGQRVRKVWEKSAHRIEERVYLGGFEVFRRRDGTGAVTLQRETLHVMDDKQRIALVETRTQGSDPAPQQLIRYQFGNHLGSASLELDEQGQIVSYEEYTPYGSTSYQAVRSQTETPKRYRYTGKERDEESGLYYHGARYYACWLGRWCSADPAGMVDGPNGYVYARNGPIGGRDPTGRQTRTPLTEEIGIDPEGNPVALTEGSAGGYADIEVEVTPEPVYEGPTISALPQEEIGLARLWRKAPKTILAAAAGLTAALEYHEQLKYHEATVRWIEAYKAESQRVAAAKAVQALLPYSGTFSGGCPFGIAAAFGAGSDLPPGHVIGGSPGVPSFLAHYFRADVEASIQKSRNINPSIAAHRAPGEWQMAAQGSGIYLTSILPHMVVWDRPKAQLTEVEIAAGMLSRGQLSARIFKSAPFRNLDRLRSVALIRVTGLQLLPTASLSGGHGMTGGVPTTYLWPTLVPLVISDPRVEYFGPSIVAPPPPRQTRARGR